MSKAPESSLGRLFNSLGVPDWEEMFVERICKKCHLPACATRCGALTVIGGLAVEFSVEGQGAAQLFAGMLRKALNSISDKQ